MIANYTQRALSFTAAAFVILNLAACGQPRPVIIAPPADLATCADAPEAPELPTKDGTDAVQMVRDQMILAYVLALRTAWGDCRARVDGLAAWRAGVEQ